MKNIFYCSLLLFLLIISCKQGGLKITSDPKAKAAESFLRSEISQESVGALEMSDFKKTNGIDRSVMGMSFYEIEYTATLNVKQTCWKSFGVMMSGWEDFRMRTKKPSENYWDTFLEGESKQYNPGQRLSTTGIITLEKTENGWRATGYETKTVR